MTNTNPDMSGLTPFKKGQSGNPGGKTNAQRAAEVKASELAATMSLKMIEALQKIVESAEAGDAEAGVEADPTAAANIIKADVLRLLGDVQDRAHGKATASVDHTSNGESINPVTKINISSAGDE